MSARKLPAVRGGGIASEHEQHRRKCRGGRVLARLVKGAVQEIATRFRLAEEQADQAGAEQHERIGARDRHQLKQPHALVQVLRPIRLVTGEDCERAIRDVRKHRKFGGIIRANQVERLARGGKHVGGVAGSKRRKRCVGKDADGLQAVHRLDGVGRTDHHSIALEHGTAPHRDMAPEVVDVDPKLQAFGEPPSRSQQVDGLLRPPAEPGVLSRVEQSRGAQLGRFGEPRRFRPGARGGRVARALASSLRGTFERRGSVRVPPARCRGEVPGSAIDVIGATHHVRQRLVGSTTISR